MNSTAVKWEYVVKENPTASGPTAYDECWTRFQRDVDAKWAEQNAPSQTQVNSNRQAAMACAQVEDLAVNDVKAIVQLAKSSANRGALRCAIIATKGYDINEHPLIVVD